MIVLISLLYVAMAVLGVSVGTAVNAVREDVKASRIFNGVIGGLIAATMIMALIIA